MDAIPFEKVSIQDAKASQEQNQTQPVRKNWRDSRADERPAALSAVTVNWMQQLPPGLQPRLLSQHFPRIANRVAELWRRPLHCERYLDDLVLDTRGGRQGFPPPVAREIAALKIHLINAMPAAPTDIWSARIGGVR